MVIFGTIALVIIAAVACLFLWALAESNSTSEADGYIGCGAIIVVILCGVGLYFLGTLGTVLSYL